MYFPLELCIGKLLPSAAGIGRVGHARALRCPTGAVPLTVPSVLLRSTGSKPSAVCSVIPPDPNGRRSVVLALLSQKPALASKLSESW